MDGLHVLDLAESEGDGGEVGGLVHDPDEGASDFEHEEDGYGGEGGDEGHEAEGEGFGEEFGEDDGEECDDEEGEGDGDDADGAGGGVVVGESEGCLDEFGDGRFAEGSEQEVDNGDTELDGTDGSGGFGFEELDGVGGAFSAAFGEGFDLGGTDGDESVLARDEECVKADEKRNGGELPEGRHGLRLWGKPPPPATRGGLTAFRYCGIFGDFLCFHMVPFMSGCWIDLAVSSRWLRGLTHCGGRDLNVFAFRLSRWVRFRGGWDWRGSGWGRWRGMRWGFRSRR